MWKKKRLKFPGIESEGGRLLDYSSENKNYNNYSHKWCPHI